MWNPQVEKVTGLGLERATQRNRDSRLTLWAQPGPQRVTRGGDCN